MKVFVDWVPEGAQAAQPGQPPAAADASGTARKSRGRAAAGPAGAFEEKLLPASMAAGQGQAQGSGRQPPARGNKPTATSASRVDPEIVTLSDSDSDSDFQEARPAAKKARPGGECTSI